MGDRWYTQQGRTITSERQKEKGLNKDGKPKRIPKKDYIEEINLLLSANITGLDKCTIDTLKQIIEAIENAEKI